MAVKLFVGGLSYSTSSDRLRDTFAAVGTVESASIVTDRDQAVNRLNGSSLDGRTIKVEKSTGAGPGGGRSPRR